MATVMKRKRKSGGIVRESVRWYVKYKTIDGKWRYIEGATDKGYTDAFGKKIDKLVACRTLGDQPSRELAEWIAGLPEDKRETLVKHGLLADVPAVLKKPLDRHLADFERSLQAKKNNPEYVQLVVRRVKRVFEGCRFKMWADIQGDAVEAYVASLQQGESGISAQTFNFYLQACKQFGRWMVQNERADKNPMAHLKRQNVKVDRRHDRRSFEVEEAQRLLATTAKAETRYGMSGYERALVYRLALETGLRANEIRSLQVASFDFQALTVTVQAGYSKRKNEDVLPIRVDTARELKAFFADKAPEDKAFGGSYQQLTDKTADMIQADLAEAGISYIDDVGRYVDFHALRHSTGSFLAAAGVNIKTIQTIMRHSDINLTMGRYAHVLRGGEAQAVAKLPDLSLSKNESKKAAG